MSLEDRLHKVFVTVFDNDSIEFKPELTADDVDEWDSLSHINLDDRHRNWNLASNSIKVRFRTSPM